MGDDVKIVDGYKPENKAKVDNGNLHVQVTSTAGNAWSINDTGQGHVVLRGEVDPCNTSNTNLGNGETFTGSACDILDYAVIQVNVYSDKPSALDGLSIQQSNLTNTGWHWTDEYSIDADSGKTFSVQSHSQYLRVLYTNGTAGTTSDFHVNTVLKKTMTKPSSHRIQDSIIDDDDAELVTNVNKAKTKSGTYVNIQATDSENLRVTDAESGLAIAKGDVVNTTFVHKFGNAPDFDTADNEITVWDGAEDGTAWELMNYVYSTTADIDSISSSDNSDTQEIEIQGLDANWELVTQTKTLTGQARVALDTPLIRIFRAFNSNATNLLGHVFVYVNGTLSGGVPVTNADIRAVIDPINQQTEMAVYTIPAGKTGYMRDWYASTAGSNRTSNYAIKLYSRLFGKIFRLKHVSAISDNGTSAHQHKYEEPEVFTEKTDIEIRTQMFASGGTEASISAGFDIILIDN